MDGDATQQRQDRRLRWKLLRILDAGKDLEAGLPGRHVMDALNEALPVAERFEDDDERRLVRLLKDLDNAGYADLVDTRTHTHQAYGLEWLLASVTAKGTRFVMGGEPPDALVDDGRIVRSSR
jgi:hypothetical protein